MHPSHAAAGLPEPKWLSLSAHRRWLRQEADDLLRFFEGASVDPEGGFSIPGTDGRPTGQADPTELHTTTRLVHGFALAAMMGRPGAMAIVDHGMRALWERHRDPANGGYVWSFDRNGPVDDKKQAYGHAFVLLAASSALMAGHPDAPRLLADVTQVLTERFWEEDHGASAEEFTADWQPFDTYRGQNSNMHLTEALMAAFEATGEDRYLAMAGRIADLVVNRHARAMNWHLPEHFRQDWSLDKAYDGNPIFRPAGTTPGHWLEWARLLVQLWELEGRRTPWMLEAARHLFARAVEDGWDAARGGFVYTLGWDGRPRIEDRYWWPVCEGIAAAAALAAVTDDPLYETWYRRIWDFAALRLIDRENGGWHPQLGADNLPKAEPFAGKPDLYHALQACLLPLLPPSVGLAVGIRAGRLDD
ncbi:AGE family epimerase/isomerase [Aureimonas sp. AU12]|uniref:AGE family epimerase/isomerase n=1 Tax=Aureimonas sp. AU12 TaxID=1638161 RepID=UPI000A455B28|nr:AGE family epimerase/isomerase [Aureimonas sp. AU12]